MKRIHVITHSSFFHADEVLAIALLSIFYPIRSITRKLDISESEFADPNTWVLDIGRRHDPGLHNFDHHQDLGLPATNMLVLEYLTVSGMLSAKAADYLRNTLFQYVSDVDTGRIPQGGNPAAFNGIIRNTDNFDYALALAKSILGGYYKNALEAEHEEAIFRQLPRFGRIVLNESGTYVREWKRLCKLEGLYFLVTPSDRGPGYNLITRNNTEASIPEHPEQTFRHATGFMAVYPTSQAAITHAEQILSAL